MTAKTPFTFAFQPIVDIEGDCVFAHEALIRGPAGESAASVLGQYQGEELLRLDMEARVRAIELAARLGLRGGLSLNFSPQSLEVYVDAISSTLTACERGGLKADQLVLEVTEEAIIEEPAVFAERVNAYRSRGLRLAIDDFGSGYAGLNLLADFQPDIVKIDMNLVRNIDSKGPRQAIARGVIQVCDELGLDVIVEGVESLAELEWFSRRGVRLFQGFLLGRPVLERLTETGYSVPVARRFRQ